MEVVPAVDVCASEPMEVEAAAPKSADSQDKRDNNIALCIPQEIGSLLGKVDTKSAMPDLKAVVDKLCQSGAGWAFLRDPATPAPRPPAQGSTARLLADNVALLAELQLLHDSRGQARPFDEENITASVLLDNIVQLGMMSAPSDLISCKDVVSKAQSDLVLHILAHLLRR